MLACGLRLSSRSTRSPARNSPVTSSAASLEGHGAFAALALAGDHHPLCPVHRGRLNLPMPGIAKLDVGHRRAPGGGSPHRRPACDSLCSSLSISTPRSRCVAQLALRGELQLRRRRAPVHLPVRPSLAESIVTPPSRWPCRGWLCSSNSSCPVGAARWPPVAVVSVKPFVASSRTADPSSRKDLRLARRSLAAAIIGRGPAQAAHLVAALELRVLGMNLDRLRAARVVNSTARSSTSRPCCESYVAPIELPAALRHGKSTCWLVVATPLFWSKVSPLVFT
jgi:hypothetical protein